MGGQLDEFPMRPETLNPLFTDTESLDGVGPKLRKPLEKLGLTRVRDLAYHLPDRFVQRRAVPDLDHAGEGAHGGVRQRLGQAGVPDDEAPAVAFDRVRRERADRDPVTQQRRRDLVVVDVVATYDDGPALAARAATGRFALVVQPRGDDS